MTSLLNSNALNDFLAGGRRRFRAAAAWEGLACRRRLKTGAAAKTTEGLKIQAHPPLATDTPLSSTASTAEPHEASDPTSPTASSVGSEAPPELFHDIQNLCGRLGSLEVSDSFNDLLEWADDEDGSNIPPSV
mmetsp:Transcript_99914/g.258193  ORF Transcript_99914/g.258193 Transcript_99914/m.258193 type:complete len:133 (-) Transcript_99914:136-534(-)